MNFLKFFQVSEKVKSFTDEPNILCKNNKCGKNRLICYTFNI